MPDPKTHVPDVTQVDTDPVQPIVPIKREPTPVQVAPEVHKPEAKTLTPVKAKEPEKINEEIDKNLTIPPQNVNFPVKFSPTAPLKKIPKKMKFKGKPGRQRTEAQVEELLTFVQARGVWPYGVSDQMQRYYKREYPEYFRKGKGKKVQTHRSTPIDLSTRRTGTNV